VIKFEDRRNNHLVFSFNLVKRFSVALFFSASINKHGKPLEKRGHWCGGKRMKVRGVHCGRKPPPWPIRQAGAAVRVTGGPLLCGSQTTTDGTQRFVGGRVSPHAGGGGGSRVWGSSRFVNLGLFMTVNIFYYTLGLDLPPPNQRRWEWYYETPSFRTPQLAQAPCVWGPIVRGEFGVLQSQQRRDACAKSYRKLFACGAAKKKKSGGKQSAVGSARQTERPSECRHRLGGVRWMG